MIGSFCTLDLMQLPNIAVNSLNFRTPENFAVIYLKFKQRGQTIWVFLQKDANWIANSEGPDQTAPLADHSVRKLRIITVSHLFILQYFDHS